MRLQHHSLLFLIILIEGYVVLATELLAMRLLIPFVGSGIETVAIIVSAVLLPLAIGYHSGGRAYQQQHRKARRKGQKALSVRAILLRNLLAALLILSLGLSYLFLEGFFAALNAVGITGRLTQTSLYTLIFLVAPVYLLGQTVPLVSNYFSRARLSAITGRMLFFSTAGSFLGSVFSTLVLMNTIGVHYTAVFTCALLFMLTLLIVRTILSYETLLGVTLLGIMLIMNHSSTLRDLGIIAANNYNTIAVLKIPKEGSKLLIVNRSRSSKIAPDPEKQFPYIYYLDKQFIQPLANANPPRDILIVGAGGFTLGLRDTVNRYTYIDIDPDLKDISERYFLKTKLTPNKRFVPASARAFVRSETARYDLVIVDVYTNVVSIPMESTTREFLQDTKNLLKPNGILAINMVESPVFADPFTIRYHNTFASVFSHFTRQVIGDINAWDTQPQTMRNVLYVYYNRPEMQDNTIYTDDKNTYSLDRP